MRALQNLIWNTRGKRWMLILFFIFSVQALSLFEANAADTTIKGTTSNSTAASLNVTNSSDNSLLYIRNDGNVGIGTTSPNYTLEVQGQASTTKLYLSSTVCAIDRSGSNAYVYIHRSPSTYDNSTWTRHATNWYSWDISSIVPAGAVVVNFRMSIFTADAGDTFRLDKDNNGASVSSIQSGTQSGWMVSSSTMEVNSDRIVYYSFADSNSNSWVGITIDGWFK